MIKALSLDPGGTTGFCYATIDEGIVTLDPGERRMSVGQLHDMLLKFVSREDDDDGCAVIYEDFQFRQGIRTGLDLTPAKLIGIIELIKSYGYLYTEFYVQQPSVQGDKAFFTDLRLKEMGVYWAHGKGHARSATKHMLYWLKFGAGGQYGAKTFELKE